MDDSDPNNSRYHKPQAMPDGYWGEVKVSGPTLRDQFAMAALTGILSMQGEQADPPSPEDFARAAYMSADAMLAARGSDEEEES